MIAETVYILCALTSASCGWLLLRAYRASGGMLLFWSAVCFMGIALNNALVCVDLIMLPNLDLSALRTGILAISFSGLIYGLVGETA